MKEPQIHQIPNRDAISGNDQYDLKVTRVEFADLHARLIALESVTISLLLTVSDRQLELAREMAEHISPREGYTPHSYLKRGQPHQSVDRSHASPSSKSLNEQRRWGVPYPVLSAEEGAMPQWA